MTDRAWPNLGTVPQVRRRDTKRSSRHGRIRGPLTLPGPLNPRGRNPVPTSGERFDAMVVALVDRLTRRWVSELDNVEFGTEDVPDIPDGWADQAPLGSLVRGRPPAPSRIVVFRRPVELRAATPQERLALVHEVLVEHIAELLGRDPDELDG